MNNEPPFDQFAWVPVGMAVFVFALWVWCKPVLKQEGLHTSLPCLDRQKPSVEVVAR